LGRSVTRAALAHGDLVTAVGRTFENTMEAMQHLAATIHLSSTSPPPSSGSSTGQSAGNDHCLGLLCDVRVRSTVDAVIKQTLQRWGRVDVVANATGYGVIGACEDQDEHEIRSQFETNFMGTLNIIQLTLPVLREQGAGRYLIFSSTSGALGVPGLGRTYMLFPHDYDDMHLKPADCGDKKPTVQLNTQWKVS
jgi:NAD(P)-dependent dehydrogenase (short-subunit alcohol dehydrogenase family)